MRCQLAPVNALLRFLGQTMRPPGKQNTHDDQSHTTLATHDVGDRNNFPPHLAAQQAPPTCPGEPVPVIASWIRSWTPGQPRRVGNGRCAATGGGGFFTTVNIAE